MLQDVVEEVSDDEAVSLDLSLMINTKHARNSVGAAEVRFEVRKRENSSQETLCNTLKVNHPIIGSVIELGIVSTNLDIIGCLDSSDFSGGRILQGFFVKSSREGLEGGIDSSEHKVLGEDIRPSRIKVTASSITLDACLNAARWVSVDN